MPVAHFQDTPNNINVVRNFQTPKYIQKPEAWLREIQKSIPQVPRLKDGWFIERFDPTISHIAIILRHNLGARCYVTVQRKVRI